MKNQENRPGQSLAIGAGCLTLLAAAGCLVTAMVFAWIAIADVPEVVRSGRSTWGDWKAAGGFIALSVLLLCAAVIVNLVVDKKDRGR